MPSLSFTYGVLALSATLDLGSASTSLSSFWPTALRFRVRVPSSLMSYSCTADVFRAVTRGVSSTSSPPPFRLDGIALISASTIEGLHRAYLLSQKIERCGTSRAFAPG